MRVALAGNPNVGKTAVMNALAGTNEKIGNWPGVTVQKKVGSYSFRGIRIELVDLPGIYSLTSYSIEEKVARNFLLKGSYDVVLDILDVTLLGRNLYLTLELLDMGIKPVIALNKVDELEGAGYTVDGEALSALLGLPVVMVSAVKGRGLDELSEELLRVAMGDTQPPGFTPVYSKDLENAVALISMKLEDALGEKPPFALRWFAIKLLEKDPEVTEEAKRLLGSTHPIFKELSKVEELVKERHRCDLPSFIARERFNLASRIAKQAIKSPAREKERLSDKVDVFVTSPFTGIPLFFAVMWLVFKLTFGVGTPAGDVVDFVFSQFLPELAEKHLSFLPGWLISLVNDGVLAGVGAVMVFLPLLGILYFVMSVLEDTGYMARTAALWDNFMRMFGLSGASVIPMILGFGCNVPAVYATRAMRSSKHKLITTMIIPWMSCSARLPVYVLFVSAFFPKKGELVVFSLYMTGVFLALFLGAVLSRFLGAGEEDFFIELPPYKLPAWNIVLNQTWIEVREFIYKAGTVIFAISILIWLMASLPPGVEYAGEGSFISSAGKVLVPLFSPLGIDSWKPVVALMFGALAKEVVVGTLGALYGAQESVVHAVKGAFSPESALAYIVFTLLYIPCVATIAAIKQETGTWRYPALAVVIQLTTAWLVGFVVYQMAGVFL